MLCLVTQNLDIALREPQLLQQINVKLLEIKSKLQS